jgi:WhiB family transcriptional regulator, redox-sensing transcriptional regulator
MPSGQAGIVMDPGGWRLSAACLDMPTDLFLSNLEATEPDPEAVAVCDRCPVRAECMAEALAYDDWGVRAGTSHRQRQQLRRRYRRVICPVCRVVGGVVLELGDAQACLTCAVSWRATPAKQGAHR